MKKKLLCATILCVAACMLGGCDSGDDKSLKNDMEEFLTADKGTIESTMEIDLEESSTEITDDEENDFGGTALQKDTTKITFHKEDGKYRFEAETTNSNEKGEKNITWTRNTEEETLETSSDGNNWSALGEKGSFDKQIELYRRPYKEEGWKIEEKDGGYVATFDDNKQNCKWTMTYKKLSEHKMQMDMENVYAEPKSTVTVHAIITK